MPRGRPVTDEERAHVCELHGQGKGRNEIADIVGLSKAAVTKIISKAGLDFEREATATAVAARKVTLADRRTRIIERLYAQIETTLDVLDGEPYKATGKAASGETVVTPIDTVPADERKASMGAISAAITAATRLEAVDAGGDDKAAGSLLVNLMAGLQARHGTD